MMKKKDFWPRTAIPTLLNNSLPIIQAPMAGKATTPELVANVSNVRSLDALGAGYMTLDDMRNIL